MLANRRFSTDQISTNIYLKIKQSPLPLELVKTDKISSMQFGLIGRDLTKYIHDSCDLIHLSFEKLTKKTTTMQIRPSLHNQEVSDRIFVE